MEGHRCFTYPCNLTYSAKNLNKKEQNNWFWISKDFFFFVLQSLFPFRFFWVLTFLQSNKCNRNIWKVINCICALHIRVRHRIQRKDVRKRVQRNYSPEEMRSWALCAKNVVGMSSSIFSELWCLTYIGSLQHFIKLSRSAKISP